MNYVTVTTKKKYYSPVFETYTGECPFCKRETIYSNEMGEWKQMQKCVHLESVHPTCSHFYFKKGE